MRPVLLYDEECPLCKRFSQSLKKIEATAHIEMIALQDDSIYSRFPELVESEVHSSLHLITEDRLILKGSESIDYLIRLTPVVKNFLWLIESDKGQKTVNFFYQSVNKYRQALRKRCTKCNKEGHLEI